MSTYIVSEALLGHKFNYPPEYLECIDWGNKEIDAGGDGHCLSFLTEPNVLSDFETFVKKTTKQPLVPFARGDNGDSLYCFDGQGTKDVYVINLGEKPLKARKNGSTNFIIFINDYRRNLDLPDWKP
jgi:hypothetical protein